MKRNRVYLPEQPNLQHLPDDDQGIKRLLAILESSFDGIFVTDAKAVPIWVNRSYEVISGLTTADVVGVPMEKLVETGIVSQSATLMAMEQGAPITIEQTFRTGRRAVVTSTPIFDRDDNIAMVVTNVRDISELTALQETLEKHRLINERYETEISVIRQQLLRSPELVAEDPAILNVFRMVGRAALLDTVVLVQGETGVGKERIAAYIHQHSPRNQKNYIRVNCGAIPENLAESELFGYERGAFTGASREGKLGLFEVADGGTIFLDEIGELSLNLQTKLLRVLQEKELTRVGGSKPVKIDVRVIAATNRDLRQAVAAGTFRDDLFYRLSVFPVHVPPLRERKLDIPKLAANVIHELNQTYGKQKTISPATIAALLQYPWPGNVRELRNVMERAFIMSDEAEITPNDLTLVRGGLSASGEPAIGGSFQEQVEHFEAQVISRALRQENGLRAAARSLQMDPATLLRKKKKYEAQSLIQ